MECLNIDFIDISSSSYAHSHVGWSYTGLLMLRHFGGIMRCDTIAEGVIAACKAVNLNVPLVVRMKGTNEDLGKKMLKESGLPIITAESMADAAKAVMAALAK